MMVGVSKIDSGNLGGDDGGDCGGVEVGVLVSIVSISFSSFMILQSILPIRPPIILICFCNSVFFLCPCKFLYLPPSLPWQQFSASTHLPSFFVVFASVTPLLFVAAALLFPLFLYFSGSCYSCMCIRNIGYSGCQNGGFY